MKLKKKSPSTSKAAGAASSSSSSAAAKPSVRDTNRRSEDPSQFDSDEEDAMGGWLRSNDGVAYMRLFVIANSLLVVMTMGWPQLWEAYLIIRDALRS